MKEFLQALLISVSLVASVGFIANGFTFSPERETMPAMDMTDMSGMEHSTNEAVDPIETSDSVEVMDMTMPGMNH